MWSDNGKRGARAGRRRLPPLWSPLVLAVVAAASATPGAWAWPAPSPGVSPSSAAASPDTPTPSPAPTPTLPPTVQTLMAKGPPMPDFLKSCRRDDPQLNNCLRDSFNTFVSGGFAGEPSLGLQSLDPLQMPFLDLSDAVPGNFTLSLLLRGVNVRGFSQSKVVNVRANLAEQKFELTARVPWLHADGSFTASGAVLMFPISAQGAFSVNMSEVSASWIMYYSERPLLEGGPNHFIIDHFEFDLSPVDVSYNFGDTLDDDNSLGEAMNQFLNMNAQEVFGDVKSRAAALLGQALRELADTVMAVFPSERLLTLPD